MEDKPVIQLSTKKKKIKRFESINNAFLHTGIPASNIVNVLVIMVDFAGDKISYIDKSTAKIITLIFGFGYFL